MLAFKSKNIMINLIQHERLGFKAIYYKWNEFIYFLGRREEWKHHGISKFPGFHPAKHDSRSIVIAGEVASVSQSNGTKEQIIERHKL